MADGISLYLIRHGIAAERGDEWPDDVKRPLIPRGVSRLRRAAAALRALDVEIDLVLTSPLVRARQTADLIAEGVAGKPPVQVMASLAPGRPYAEFLADLVKHAGRSRVACVGHEPDLGHVAARLIGAKAPIPFKKGAVCRIDFDALPNGGPGQLRWFLTPRILQRIKP